MNQNNNTLKTSLENVIEMLQREINSLQIVGRALTPAEVKRIDSLAQTIENLNLLLNSSAGITDEDNSVSADTSNIILRDGRFTVVGTHLQADLRLDTRQSGIMSMDFYLGSVATGEYVASLRSNPGATVRSGQRRIEVVGQDDNGNQTSGFVEITPISEIQATVTVNLVGGLNSLPVNVVFAMSAAWQSSYFRTIGLEIDTEAGNGQLPEFFFNGRNITVESCFGDAGLEIIPVGRRDTIPVKQGGWVDAELHGLMNNFANEQLNRQAWALHLMILTKSATDGLLGVMFDTGTFDANHFPRQGVAVFTEPIRGHRAGFERKIIQTITHELGHALNLAHRFERQVSRADSTSCMNYDWKYFGGGRQDQFWRDFQFGFDSDELRFLRHSPRTAMIPGGADFHTVNYWSDGTGGYSPYYREVALPGLTLELRLPLSGALFAFAQPIILMVNLKNISGQRLEISRQFLDPKGRFLEILIRRLNSPFSGGNEQMSFSPLVNRCWDLSDLDSADRVENGESISNNVNLTFGSSGFTFAEPGDYEIMAVISIPDQTREIDQIIKSAPVRIRVAHPQSLQEERDAMDIFQKDIGFYIALGGSDILPKEEDKLLEICERRNETPSNDPLVAHIMRIEAINKSRDFTTFDDDSGKFKVRESKPEEALNILNQLDEGGQKFFDEATQTGLKNLREDLEKQVLA